MNNIIQIQHYLMQRIKVDPITKCWMWQLQLQKGGHGRCRIPKTRIIVSTHRLSYEVFVGPIPEGLNVCHSCDTPACINPDHLWVGTQAQNLEDMTIKGRRVRPWSLKVVA